METSSDASSSPGEQPKEPGEKNGRGALLISVGLTVALALLIALNMN
jgi:hypothetical protein